MLFSRQLSTSNLIQLCRVLRHSLGAGLALREVFRQQGRKGFPAIRPVAERISLHLEHGEDLEGALTKEKASFPPLFLSLVGVGERTGNLPEVCGDMEQYYLMQQKLWRDFLRQITAPTLQLVAAILVISGMIYILGLIGSMQNSKPFDPLGIGLTGTNGALAFLFIGFGSMFGLIFGYMLASRSLRYGGAVDRFLLGLPVIGPCMMALALARFCLALRLVLDTSLRLKEGLTLALRATGNSAFMAKAPMVTEAIKAGDDLTTALGKTKLFPEMFMSVLAVGEESGRVPEVMQHQSVHYQEEAALRMTVLTRVAGFAVWTIIAAIIIVAIFRIFMAYLAQIQMNMPK